MLLSYGYGQQWIGDNNKSRQINGDFDCHTDVAVRRGAHHPIQHIQGKGGIDNNKFKNNLKTKIWSTDLIDLRILSNNHLVHIWQKKYHNPYILCP